MDDDIAKSIVAFKRAMAPRREVLKRSFGEVKDHVRRMVEDIRRDASAERPVIPEIDYRNIEEGSVPDEMQQAIRRTGCAVIRGVFPSNMARDWFDELSGYLQSNRYEEREVEKRSLDKYFSALKAGKPQIFNVYWSKPQVRARQDAKLVNTRAFLNRFWTSDGVFDPDRQCSYADRVRRREPGDTTLGLSPHMDGGSVERWIDPGFQNVYQNIFTGDWRRHDHFDGRHRLETKEIPFPAVCSVFRTYQGWTALTRQGPDDGTLQLLPLADGISYLLLRAMQDDVAEDDLCGATSGRALGVNAEWHEDLVSGMVSIPEVQPGDTAWWHPDVCHAVGDKHEGREYASVLYIGSAPDCAKNRRYLPKQKAAFLDGRSAPDFAAMDLEVDFDGRAAEKDLTDLGRHQMGF